MNSKLIKALVLLLSIICVACPKAYTSEGDFLSWEKISAEFSSGVSIAVEANGPIYKKFVINAFDQSFELDQEDLNKIEGLSLSLLNVTHEAGYEETGGETIYFRLSNYLFVGAGGNIKTAVLKVQKKGISISEDYITPPQAAQSPIK